MPPPPLSAHWCPRCPGRATDPAMTAAGGRCAGGWGSHSTCPGGTHRSRSSTFRLWAAVGLQVQGSRRVPALLTPASPEPWSLLPGSEPGWGWRRGSGAQGVGVRGWGSWVPGSLPWAPEGKLVRCRPGEGCRGEGRVPCSTTCRRPGKLWGGSDPPVAEYVAPTLWQRKWVSRSPRLASCRTAPVLSTGPLFLFSLCFSQGQS